MLLAPGHSLRRQSVAVETEKGTIVTSGFCSVKENLGTDKDKICVPGSSINMLQAYDNIMKVKQVGESLFRCMIWSM